MKSTLERIKSTVPVKTKTTKTELLAYFENSWELYNCLFSSIKAEDSYYIAPDPLRHPLIFYWGHTAAFYLNKLIMAGLLKEGINPHYEELFAKGVDPNLPEELKKDFKWPEVSAVNQYRDQVFKIVKQLILEQEEEIDINDQQPLWALLMGIEHDRIHFETSSVLIRQLDEKLLERPEGWEYAPTLGEAAPNEFINLKGGIVKIGKPKESDLYGWDNEYGSRKVEVLPFKASKNLISNQEYLEFFNSGAYNDQKYWTKEGWDWKERVDCKHPKFWVPTANGFKYRAMFDLLEMPLDWPVEVNAHEAWAYCHWKGEGYRLMSEAEFNLIAHQALGSKDCVFSDCYNLNMRYGSPSPVGYMEDGQHHFGFNDLFGNVWDWLKDDFYPLKGYETHYLYEDFSEPYFDSEHSMLAGPSWATTGTGASKYYRLWFRRHFYQHAGFRLAKSID
jgi:5-histidylcysteine sulfoxide synthase